MFGCRVSFGNWKVPACKDWIKSLFGETIKNTRMNSPTINTILAQKRTAAIRSQMFFGGISGSSVSSSVGMPCKKKGDRQSRTRGHHLIQTDSDKVHFCRFPDFGAHDNFVAKV